jgi:putative membrane protein
MVFLGVVAQHASTMTPVRRSRLADALRHVVPGRRNQHLSWRLAARRCGSMLMIGAESNSDKPQCPEATMTDDKKTATELAMARTNMAASRTLMAIDRTLMAWVRTALSMISFGFTIYKILQTFQADGMVLPNPTAPRNVGLYLIGLGTVSMIMGMVEYWGSIRQLRQLEHVRLLRPSLIMALLMSAMGLALFVGISGRML